MITGKVEIVFNDLPLYARLSAERTAQAIRAAAQEGRNIAVESIRSPSPGFPQTRHNPERVVIASAPGFPPNADTGNLMNSINVRPGAGRFEQIITVGAEYGYTLEFGLPDGSSRPFMLPMADEIRGRLPDFFRAAFTGMYK